MELASCYINVIIYPMGTDCILVSSDEGAGNGPEHPTSFVNIYFCFTLQVLRIFSFYNKLV